jgi:hypothetical protein
MAKYVAKGYKLITPTSQVLKQHITMTKCCQIVQSQIYSSCVQFTYTISQHYNNATNGCQNL